MQDEINQQTVALMIHGTKISVEIFRQAMVALARKRNQLTDKIEINTTKHGKQSLRSLQNQGAQLSTVKISEENIGEFESIAKKYEIDYSLKRDRNPDHPCYIVLFKARDVDLMDAAFREYAGNVLEHEADQKKDRLPLRERMETLQRERKSKEKAPREKYKYREEPSR